MRPKSQVSISMKVKCLLFSLGCYRNHINSTPNCMNVYILSIYIIIVSLEQISVEKDKFLIDFTILFFFKINFHGNNIKYPSNIDFTILFFFKINLHGNNIKYPSNINSMSFNPKLPPTKINFTILIVVYMHNLQKE